MDTWVASLSWITVNNGAIISCVGFIISCTCFKSVFSCSLDIYPEMELLNHIIVLFLVSGGISLVAVPVNIPTNSV